MTTLRDFLTAAMARAHYEIVEDEESYYGEIPGFQGLWATGDSPEDCRQNLMAALEDWILFSSWHGEPRQPGGWEGQIWISADFDDPLPPEILDTFEESLGLKSET
jgi:predicted RNase H-like HicB family nuclease